MCTWHDSSTSTSSSSSSTMIIYTIPKLKLHVHVHALRHSLKHVYVYVRTCTLCSFFSWTSLSRSLSKSPSKSVWSSEWRELASSDTASCCTGTVLTLWTHAVRFHGCTLCILSWDPVLQAVGNLSLRGKYAWGRWNSGLWSTGRPLNMCLLFSWGPVLHAVGDLSLWGSYMWRRCNPGLISTGRFLSTRLILHRNLQAHEVTLISEERQVVNDHIHTLYM